MSLQIKLLSVSICSVKRQIRYENRRVSLQHFKLKRGLRVIAVRQRVVTFVHFIQTVVKDDKLIMNPSPELFCMFLITLIKIFGH